MQPEFFVDRSLGRHRLAVALRAARWVVATHHEVYAERDETVPDVEWLEYCAERSLVVLSKDRRLRYNPAEIDAIRRLGVRAFVLSRGNLTARKSRSARERGRDTSLSIRHQLLFNSQRRADTAVTPSAALSL